MFGLIKYMYYKFIIAFDQMITLITLIVRTTKSVSKELLILLNLYTSLLLNIETIIHVG